MTIQWIEREAYFILCPNCGGFAGRVPNTDAECNDGEIGCGRDMPQAECCARAFACSQCGVRTVRKAEPPEME